LKKETKIPFSNTLDNLLWHWPNSVQFRVSLYLQLFLEGLHKFNVNDVTAREKEVITGILRGNGTKSYTGHRTVVSGKRYSRTECPAVANTPRVTASYQIYPRLLPTCPIV